MCGIREVKSEELLEFDGLDNQQAPCQMSALVSQPSTIQGQICLASKMG